MERSGRSDVTTEVNASDVMARVNGGGVTGDISGNKVVFPEGL